MISLTRKLFTIIRNDTNSFIRNSKQIIQNSSLRKIDGNRKEYQPRNCRTNVDAAWMLYRHGKIE